MCHRIGFHVLKNQRAVNTQNKMTHCDADDCFVFLPLLVRLVFFLIRHFANRQFLVSVFANYYYYFSSFDFLVSAIS